ATALGTRFYSSFIARVRSSVPSLAGSAPILSSAAMTSGSLTIAAIRNDASNPGLQAKLKDTFTRMQSLSCLRRLSHTDSERRYSLRGTVQNHTFVHGGALES